VGHDKPTAGSNRQDGWRSWAERWWPAVGQLYTAAPWVGRASFSFFLFSFFFGMGTQDTMVEKIGRIKAENIGQLITVMKTPPVRGFREAQGHNTRKRKEDPMARITGMRGFFSKQENQLGKRRKYVGIIRDHFQKQSVHSNSNSNGKNPSNMEGASSMGAVQNKNMESSPHGKAKISPAGEWVLGSSEGKNSLGV
jgi:hypothetical protein